MDELQQSSTGAQLLETLRDITANIIDYLKELSHYTPYLIFDEK